MYLSFLSRLYNKIHQFPERMIVKLKFLIIFCPAHWGYSKDPPMLYAQIDEILSELLYL